ncbi:MAG: S8 family serine peptidase [Phycisphaerales bacterium]|nr:S8 family serine peptidase [Phycisphaerales bacterium]
MSISTTGWSSRLLVAAGRVRGAKGCIPPSDSFDLMPLECRAMLSGAFDVTGLSALRGDGNYAGIDGSDIGIAIIDTGLFSSHPDLAPNFVAWYDAVQRTSGNAPFDPNGHGSHVAGTAAARNPEIGVATRARLIGIRALPDDNEPYPNHDTVAEALRWVLDNHAAHNIRVVNMSLGVPGLNINDERPRTTMQATLIGELEQVGVTVVTASGNGYSDFGVAGASSPAIYSTIQVANTWEDNGVGDQFPDAGGGQDYVAVDFNAQVDRFAASSQRSTLPNQVAAPGTTILSSWNGQGGRNYNTISGTSMASPLVTGMVALMQDAAFTYGGRYLSAAEVVSIIRTTADEIVDTDHTSNGRAEIIRDIFGGARLGDVENLPETGFTYKRVNIYRAIQSVRGLVTGSPIPMPGQPTGDVNNSVPEAIGVPNLDGSRDYTIGGHVGLDGQVSAGADDVDLYRVVLDSPGVVTFTAPGENNATTPRLRLFNQAGVQMGAGAGVLVTGRLEAGTYYLGVSSVGNESYVIADGSGGAGGSEQGGYTLTVSPANPDPNGAITGAVPFEGIPNFYEGRIGSDVGRPVGPQDVDFFEIVAPDDGVLTIDIDALSIYGGTAVDSFVRVFNSSLVQIASNDDDGTDTDSLLDVTLVKGQRIYVAISDFGNQAYDPADPFDRVSAGPGGFYDLYFFFDNGDTNGTIFGATVGAIDTPISAAIGPDGATTVGADGTKDVDFYKFTASAAALLDITITSGDGSLSSSLSFWRYDEIDVSAERLGEVNGVSPRLIIQVGAGETIWVAVTGRGNQDFSWFGSATGAGGDTGSYTLTSTLRPLSELVTLSDNSVQQGTVRALVLGTSATGELGTDGALIVGERDVDVFSFVPTETREYRFRTSAPGEDSADTFLRVFDSLGNELSYNDDFRQGDLSSSVVIALTAGQTYYIGVNGYSPDARDYHVLTGAGIPEGSTGDYTLRVTAIDGREHVRSATGVSAEGSSDSQGLLTVTIVNADGDPVAFTQDSSGAWRAEIIGDTSGPASAGPVVTWVDPRDNRAYGASSGDVGVILYVNTGGQGSPEWTSLNLTDATSGGGALRSGITAFVGTDGVIHIAGIMNDGDLGMYMSSGLIDAQGVPMFMFHNLGQELRANGLTMPAYSGDLISYVTSWNGLNIAGLDAAGQIHSVWWAPGVAHWSTNNLSAQTGAPALVGGLSVYLTGWGGINLAGIDADKRVSVTWWVPEFIGEWRTNNLTDEIGGPLMNASSVNAYVTSWGGLNIAGRSEDGRVMVYWWAPASNRWDVAALSDQIPGAPIPNGPIRGVTNTSAEPINLLFSTDSGDVIRYRWRLATNEWGAENLTGLVPVG